MLADIPDAGGDGTTLERSENLVRWLPPPRVGSVYTVINRVEQGPIEVGVKWGSWQIRETVPLREQCGLVLRLEHNKADSWPLAVDTSGTIEIGPTQVGPPTQWSDPAYLKLTW